MPPGFVVCSFVLEPNSEACGSSQAKDQTHTTAATWAVAGSDNTRSLTCCITRELPDHAPCSWGIWGEHADLVPEPRIINLALPVERLGAGWGKGWGSPGETEGKPLAGDQGVEQIIAKVRDPGSVPCSFYPRWAGGEAPISSPPWELSYSVSFIHSIIQSTENKIQDDTDQLYPRRQ